MTSVRCPCGAPACRIVLAGPSTVFLCDTCPAPKVARRKRVVTVPP